ncbi:MAG: type I DNA topoisomerase [Candidatus Omnitrophica bacterium]|nr:type I DNA topoisomerase [Candidatus Omnitrophota bacterium]MDD5310833.1 type I DNA topoisomerase [Candidatus Omnitrophota bacterium]MDD5546782.1 type I DNA topoisomerase [Candidatus Omnitrophota bacterium]
MIKICVNGKDIQADDGITVAGLISDLKADVKYAAVELNLNILDRSKYDSVKLKEGDKVEIILPVGGGKGGALVIVESPAKAKTIEKFLGKGYTVRSSMGHVIDLPMRKMGIDIENNFTPTYKVIAKKKKLLSELKAEAKDKDTIYIATDPDREGEAIGWHLAGYLGKNKEVKRVVFHEITKKAILEAFDNPAEIDIKLVNAQQARRVLDRIVGYSLSPLLWKKITRGLSAGRVQSVAVKLIVDREREIQAFVAVEYWELEAELKKKKDKKSFFAQLDKINDAKAEVKDKASSDKILAELSGAKYTVKDIKETEKRLNPQAPFTTSKMQQESFNKLHYRAGKTMKIAQQLYEGLDIGTEGTVGLITYMRTDSVKVAFSAIEEARFYIKDKFGKDYLPPEANVYKSKKAAQEAHEAIRPSSAAREPDAIKQYLTPDQYKLYKLIWAKFIASQMRPAVMSVVSIDIEAEKCLFRASGSTVIFPGFKAAYDDEEEEKDKKKAYIPKLAIGDTVDLIKLDPTRHFTKPPPRFTDASLVKALEEDGIGRPSTYAPTIETVVARNYVRREGSALWPTELGTVVNDLLTQSFPVIIDEEFTAKMEEELDEIEEGKVEWAQALKDFYGPFSRWLSKAQVEMKDVKKDVEELDEVCEKCGRKMIIKWGRRGRFKSCSGFPECKNAKPLVTTGIKCPEPGCDGELVERRSRRGAFYGCSRFPTCRHVENKPKPSQEGEVQSPAGDKPKPQQSEEGAQSLSSDREKPPQEPQP